MNTIMVKKSNSRFVHGKRQSRFAAISKHGQSISNASSPHDIAQKLNRILVNDQESLVAVMDKFIEQLSGECADSTSGVSSGSSSDQNTTTAADDTGLEIVRRPPSPDTAGVSSDDDCSEESDSDKYTDDDDIEYIDGSERSISPLPRKRAHRMETICLDSDDNDSQASREVQIEVDTDDDSLSDDGVSGTSASSSGSESDGSRASSMYGMKVGVCKRKRHNDDYNDDDDDDDDDDDYETPPQSRSSKRKRAITETKRGVSKRMRIVDCSSSDDEEHVHTTTDVQSKNSDGVANLLREVHTVMFKKNLPTYAMFDSEGDLGIPSLVKHFNEHECHLVNTTDTYSEYIDCAADYRKFAHVNGYLIAAEFNRSLLSTRRYDSVVEALYSYLIQFSIESLREFATVYPEHRFVLEPIVEFKENPEHRIQVTVCRNGVPRVHTCWRLLKNVFRDEKPEDQIVDEDSIRKDFNLNDHMDNAFAKHLRNVWQILIGPGFNPQLIAELLEVEMRIPVDLPNVDLHEIRRRRDNDIDNLHVIKFITGEACVGKTTMLTAMAKMGWRPFSRGDLGTFGGKASNPVDVGNLHAALDFMLRQPDVIGGECFCVFCLSLYAIKWLIFRSWLYRQHCLVIYYATMRPQTQGDVH